MFGQKTTLRDLELCLCSDCGIVFDIYKKQVVDSYTPHGLTTEIYCQNCYPGYDVSVTVRTDDIQETRFFKKMRFGSFDYYIELKFEEGAFRDKSL